MFPNICEDAVKPVKPQQLFTFCTLVTCLKQYTAFVNSFISGGFDDTTSKYIYINNIGLNSYEAYAGLNIMIAQATTPYIILCHQDLTLIKDGYVELVQKLDELDRVDLNWAVAGNAGGVAKGQYAMHVTLFNNRVMKLGALPTKVESLDENFIIVKRSANIGFSNDLAGFHFYGIDLVIQAELRGYTSYVIDFHLHHYGKGKIDKSFYQCQAALENKYHKLFQTRYLQAPCRRILLTSSRLKLALQLFKVRRKIKRLPVGL
jgi:glycosyltransferase involved in cell wall biosynthesis